MLKTEIAGREGHLPLARARKKDRTWKLRVGDRGGQIKWKTKSTSAAAAAALHLLHAQGKQLMLLVWGLKQQDLPLHAVLIVMFIPCTGS